MTARRSSTPNALAALVAALLATLRPPAPAPPSLRRRKPRPPIEPVEAPPAVLGVPHLQPEEFCELVWHAGRISCCIVASRADTAVYEIWVTRRDGRLVAPIRTARSLRVARVVANGLQAVVDRDMAGQRIVAGVADQFARPAGMDRELVADREALRQRLSESRESLETLSATVGISRDDLSSARLAVTHYQTLLERAERATEASS